ncbi:MAG: hypothetical protein Q8P01_01485 [bacterium]|nr:hypothetical protein [bacterium]
MCNETPSGVPAKAMESAAVVTIAVIAEIVLLIIAAVARIF